MCTSVCEYHTVVSKHNDCRKLALAFFHESPPTIQCNLHNLVMGYSHSPSYHFRGCATHFCNLHMPYHDGANLEIALCFIKVSHKNRTLNHTLSLWRKLSQRLENHLDLLTVTSCLPFFCMAKISYYVLTVDVTQLLESLPCYTSNH